MGKKLCPILGGAFIGNQTLMATTYPPKEGVGAITDCKEGECAWWNVVDDETLGGACAIKGLAKIVDLALRI